MAVVRAITLVAAVVLGACGGSGPDADDAGSTSTTATTAPVNVAISPTPSDLAAPATPSGRPTASDPKAHPAGPASTTASAPTGSPAPPAGSGLIKGSVERDCAERPEQGGGCYNQAAGVAGATVELRSASGAVLASAVTDGDGRFEFRPAAGRYVIRERSSGVSQARTVESGRTTFVTLVIPAS